MRLIYENGVKLLIYDSIEELPMWRFKEYNKALMLDVGLGSTADSVAQHIGRWIALTEHDKLEEAKQELSNLQQNIMYVIAGVNFEMSSFCALIKEIDDKPFDNLSEDHINELTKKLSNKGFTYGKLKHFLYDAKKKWTLNLKFFSRTKGPTQKPETTS